MGVENGHTEVRFFDLEDNILIEVSDDGVGIRRGALTSVCLSVFIEWIKVVHETRVGLD